MNPNHTKKALTVIILLITCTATFAQNCNTTDSLETLLKTVNKNEKAKLLNELAKEYLPDLPENAKENASLALQHAKKQNNRIEQAFALKYIGVALYYQSKHEEALEYYNNSIHIFKELDNKSEIAKLFNNIGLIYEELNNYEDALVYHQKSLKIQEKIKDRNKIAISLNNIGAIYKELNNYKKALEYYQKSLKIKEEIKDEKGIAISLNNIGNIYKEFNNYEDALVYYQKSLKIEEEFGDKKGIAYSLNNIGTIYKELNNYEDALEYYQKSVTIIEEIGDKKGVAYSLNNIGTIYKELNNYENALEYYQKSLKIEEEFGDKKGIAISLNNIGELYNKLGNFSEALLYFNKSLEIAKSLNIKYIMIYNYLSFSESYSAMDNYKKAFKYYKQYTTLKDSVFNLETYKQIADMKTRYETEKKDKQIQTLEYENNIKTIKINHHKKTQYIYITGLLLTLIAITLILIQYRKKNNAYKFLVQKNIDLLNKEEELKIIKKKISGNEPNNNRKITISDNIKEEILEKLGQLLDNEKVFRDIDLTIDKLAKSISTNRNYLSQTIYKEFGKSYIDFINEYRIKEAMLLLSDPQKCFRLSIDGIAKETGFRSVPCFNSAFKKFTGITPSTFRQESIGL